MGDTKTKQNGEKSYIVRRLIDLALSALLIIAVIYGIKSVTGDFNDINRVNSVDDEIISPNVNKPQFGAIIYVTEMMDNDTVSSGPLIVVNDKIEYKGNEDDLVSMYNVKEDDGTQSYLVMSADVKLRKDAANALNDMVKAFASETDHDDIVVDGGYRSVKFQQELYDAADDKSKAAKPGFSDYHTGYSIDLGISADDGTVGDFDGKGDYSWFEKNCYRYGFVLRYPDGKNDKTGFDYRPWHFRYVGTAHAYYMYKNNLCLEEYIEKLKTTYEYTQEHLTFSNDNGNDYEAYYYPVDETSSFTMIAVPSEMEYQISGNNDGGFIICFDQNASKTDGSENSNEEEKNNKDSKSDKEDSSEKENNKEDSSKSSDTD